ncbi:MAG TPA: outer membrane beta-barrel protein [Allosphingosinicella sp.]|nr:outer membrane beta-barrel protein [Allosphingosinicella sp.]
MRKIIVAALLAGGLATPAFAQDAAPFSGFHVEGIVGYDTTDVEGEGTNGIVYGIGAGYDIQSGNLVFGIDGEASKSTLDECVASVDVTGDELCAEAGRELSVGGRLGFVVGSNALVYARAGYTNARVNIDYDHPTNNTLDLNEGDNLDGVRVGGGVELALGTNAFVRAEYRYSNYEQGFDRHQAVGGFGFRF